MTDAGLDRYRTPRPQRADAARNFDAVVAAAFDTFAEDGPDAALEVVADRAGVGIATLYRNFPTREALLKHLYVTEVQLAIAEAGRIADLSPWDALVAWLRTFVRHIGAKQRLATALDPADEVLDACRTAILGAAMPVVHRVRGSGDLGTGISDDDLTRIVFILGTADFESDAQRQRILDVLLAGIRTKQKEQPGALHGSAGRPSD